MGMKIPKAEELHSRVIFWQLLEVPRIIWQEQSEL